MGRVGMAAYVLAIRSWQLRWGTTRIRTQHPEAAPGCLPRLEHHLAGCHPRGLPDQREPRRNAHPYIVRHRPRQGPCPNARGSRGARDWRSNPITQAKGEPLYRQPFSGVPRGAAPVGVIADKGYSYPRCRRLLRPPGTVPTPFPSAPINGRGVRYGPVARWPSTT